MMSTWQSPQEPEPLQFQTLPQLSYTCGGRACDGASCVSGEAPAASGAHPADVDQPREIERLSWVSGQRAGKARRASTSFAFMSWRIGPRLVVISICAWV